MGNQSYLTLLLWTLLMSSLLLSTWSTAQRSEDSRTNSIMINRRLAVTSRGAGRAIDSEATISESESLRHNITDNDSSRQGQGDRIPVEDSEPVTIGVVQKLDAEVTKTPSNSSEQPEQERLCVYFVVIRTGDQDGAGTNSDISLRLSDRLGDEVHFSHLQNGHRTFEKGHEDTFELRERPCVYNICRMVLSTDDYGLFSEWFVVGLKFSVATLENNGLPGPIVQERRWEIYEWLPKEDDKEELYTIRDDCYRTN